MMMETPGKSIMDEVFPAVRDFRLQMSCGSAESSQRKRSMTSECGGNVSKRLCSSLELSFEEQLDQEKEDFLHRSQIVENETIIIDLENQIKYLKSEIERINIEHEVSFEKLKRKYGNDSLRLANVEMELQQSTQKNKLIVQRLTEQLDAQTEKNNNLEREVVELKMKNSQEENEYEERIDLMSGEMDETRNDNLTLETQLTQLLHQVEQKEEELDEANERKAELSAQLLIVQENVGDSEALKRRVRDLEDEIMQVKVDCKVGILLKDKLKRMEEVEEENRKLRSENDFHRETADNNVMLQLQKESVERKLAEAEAELENFSELQIKHEALKHRLSKWEVENDDSECLTSPDELSRQISNLQSENLAMLERQGQLETLANKARLQQVEAVDEMKNVKRELFELQKRNEQQIDALQRSNQQLDVVAKERDSLKELVLSYETSKSLRLNASILKRMRDAESASKQYEKLLKEREKEMNQLAEQLNNAQTATHKLQVDVEIMRASQEERTSEPSSNVHQNLIMSLRQHISQSEEALAEALADKKKLQIQLKQAEASVSTVSTPRLSLTDEDIDRMRQKNDELRTRVKLLKSPKGSVIDPSNDLSNDQHLEETV